MSSDFSYLIEKIRNAEFRTEPFKHIYIEDFFDEKHFAELSQSPEINLSEQNSDPELFDALDSAGYKAIEFPGCITDRKKYMTWRQSDRKKSRSSSTEGFGMTLRLYEPKSKIVKEVKDFVTGPEFNLAIAEKFNLDFGACKVDGGIQKYLDGYEISPHPDIRRKAATFMVNINPSEKSAAANHHTHYMAFRSERTYVRSFWEGNPKIDRCWVPWDWCDTKYQQTANNSIVIFAPADDTIHAVKASYDHLVTQRTQLYGNLWYKSVEIDKSLPWEQVDLLNQRSLSLAKGGLKSAIPVPVKRRLKKLQKALTSSNSVGQRN
ncbi:hypothetical protein [Tropicimonas sp. S265A]|uniref:hypothetical protein n=1 Tax=Tropicimonas sp. S265A TaxID=3415134 RepID=UPI003C7CE43A